MGTFGPIARFLFQVRRRNTRRIPKKGPCILVVNHVSNLDPVVVVAAVRRPVLHLAKHTLFTKRFRSFFFQRVLGQIPVNRERGGNEAAIEAALHALEQGAALAVYPEGSRSPDGRLQRGRSGLGRLALLSGAPCIPVAVDGMFEVLPKHRKMPRLLRPVRVLVGEPRRWSPDPERAADRDACQAITDELMSELARLLGQSYAYDPSRPDDGAAPVAPNV